MLRIRMVAWVDDWGKSRFLLQQRFLGLWWYIDPMDGEFTGRGQARQYYWCRSEKIATKCAKKLLRQDLLRRTALTTTPKEITYVFGEEVED